MSAIQYFFDDETGKHHQFVDLQESVHSRKAQASHIHVVGEISERERQRICSAIATDINAQKNPKHESKVVRL